MERIETKAQVWLRRLTAGMLMGMVLFFSVLFFVTEKKDFSENENRSLADVPKFGWRQVQEGAYMEGLTDYVSDHFPFRDFWVGLKTKTELV